MRKRSPSSRLVHFVATKRVAAPTRSSSYNFEIWHVAFLGTSEYCWELGSASIAPAPARVSRVLLFVYTCTMKH